MIYKKDFKQSAMSLAKAGADLTVLSLKGGKTLLHILACENIRGAHNQEIAELVKLNPNVLAIRDWRGRTPLQSLIDDLYYYKIPFNDL